MPKHSAPEGRFAESRHSKRMPVALMLLAALLAGCALYSLTRGLLSHGSAAASLAASGHGAPVTAGFWPTLVAVAPPVAFLLIAMRRLAAPWRYAGMLAVLAAAAASVWVAHADGTLRYIRLAYLADHVVANLTFAQWFARTLRPGVEPLCTEVARRVHRNLTPRVVRYTRGVTVTWAVLFTVVALASMVLYAIEPFQAWTHFVWFSTAPLTVAVFAVEYAIRCMVIPANERSAAIDTFRAIATMFRSSHGDSLRSPHGDSLRSSHGDSLRPSHGDSLRSPRAGTPQPSRTGSH
jgi:uncharacterized membrane protein